MPLSSVSFPLTDSPVSHILDTVGDGSGIVDAVGNYAAVATDFKLVPASNEIMYLGMLHCIYADVGGFIAGGYASLVAPGLTVGIKMAVKNSVGVVHNFTNTHPVKTNGDWAIYAESYDIIPFGGGENMARARMDFIDPNTPVVVDGRKGEYFAVTLNDDFTLLTQQHFRVDGWFVVAR